MKPDHEIIELVATKVMGWNKDPGHDDIGYWYKDGRPIVALKNWNPLESIEDAWEVVVKLKDIEDGFTIMFDTEEKQWRAGALWWRQYEEASWWRPKSAIAETAQRAICLASLKAVGVEI